MSKNKIKPNKHSIRVELDPSYLIGHATYMPNGDIVERVQMTVGQIIEGIAYAHIKHKMPEKAGLCKIGRIVFEDDKFIVTFADSVDHL